MSENPLDDAEITPEAPKTGTQALDLSMALDSHDPLDVARMDVFIPGSSSRPIGWIDFCGPGHPKAIQLSNDAQRINLRQAEQRAIKGSRWKPDRKTPEEAMEETVRWVCDRIVGWSIKATADDGGQKIIVDVPFTNQTATKLFGDPRKSWLLNAAVEFILAVENFMPSFSAS